MEREDWTVPIEADGSWLCEHANAEGGLAPPTRLRAADAVAERPGNTAENAAGLLRCPDCGTYWRVWERLGVAKCFAATPWYLPDALRPPADAPRLRRSRVRDIDRLIAAVCARLPAVNVTQLTQYRPGDDENVWWFGLPGVKSDVQIECLNGACPFSVETDELSSYDARTAHTVEEAVGIILDELTRPRA